MSLKARLLDGGGTGREAWVGDQGGLFVSLLACPPFVPQKNKVFRAYFENAAGSNDMGVDGTTPVDFFVPASDDGDLYVTRVDFLVGYGAAAEPFEWADSGGALANGHRFFYERETEQIDVHEAVQRNSDMIRLALKDLMPTAWEVRGIGATNDYGYLGSIDLLGMMPPYGVKLDAGSSQRLVWQIRDDLTGHTDTFNAVAYGFERFA